MSDHRGRTRLAIVRGRASAPPDDHALVRGLLEADPEAETAAFHRLAPLVHRVLRRMLGREDVEDIAQEVFLRVFHRIGTVRDPQALPAFALQVASRAAQWELHKRRLRSFIQLSPTGSAPDEAAVHPDLDARQALECFYQLLDQLGPADRIAFVLRHVEGLDVREMAAVLGVSESTAKRRSSRAWKRVRARLSQQPVLLGYLSSLAGRGSRD